MPTRVENLEDLERGMLKKGEGQSDLFVYSFAEEGLAPVNVTVRSKMPGRTWPSIIYIEISMPKEYYEIFEDLNPPFKAEELEGGDHKKIFEDLSKLISSNSLSESPTFEKKTKEGDKVLLECVAERKE